MAEFPYLKKLKALDLSSSVIYSSMEWQGKFAQVLTSFYFIKNGCESLFFIFQGISFMSLLCFRIKEFD